MINNLLKFSLLLFLSIMIFSCTKTTEEVIPDPPCDLYYAPDFVEITELETEGFISDVPMLQGNESGLVFSVSNIIDYDGARFASDPYAITIDNKTGSIILKKDHQLVAGDYMIDVLAFNDDGFASFSKAFYISILPAGPAKYIYSKTSQEGSVTYGVVTDDIVSDQPFSYGVQPVVSTISSVVKDGVVLTNHYFEITDDGIVFIDGTDDDDGKGDDEITVEPGDYTVSVTTSNSEGNSVVSILFEITETED